MIMLSAVVCVQNMNARGPRYGRLDTRWGDYTPLAAYTNGAILYTW